jgi:hypothetical protein
MIVLAIEIGPDGHIQSHLDGVLVSTHLGLDDPASIWYLKPPYWKV